MSNDLKFDVSEWLENKAMQLKWNEMISLSLNMDNLAVNNHRKMRYLDPCDNVPPGVILDHPNNLLSNPIGMSTGITCLGKDPTCSRYSWQILTSLVFPMLKIKLEIWSCDNVVGKQFGKDYFVMNKNDEYYNVLEWSTK